MRIKDINRKAITFLYLRFTFSVRSFVCSLERTLRLSAYSFVVYKPFAHLFVCSFVGRKERFCSFVVRMLHIRIFVCLFVLLFVCSFVRIFVCLFIRSFVCSFVRLFVRSFVGWKEHFCVFSWSELPQASSQHRTWLEFRKSFFLSQHFFTIFFLSQHFF